MKPKSFLAKSIATLLAAGVTFPSALHALPQGAQVQAGAASFTRAGGALGIVTSDRAIINYSSFSIGTGESVNFIQPSALSITLNRVTDPNPSHIFGTLTSNGKIVLANPYGIYFENGSVVNVGGLIAGAGRIADSDFLAGRMNFSSLTGDVKNRGSIIAMDDVALYGAHVSNEGVITSQKGSVTLAAGSSVYVGEAGGNIFVGTAPAAIPKPRVISQPHVPKSGVAGASAPRPAVKNTGAITAPKATLVAGDMYGIAIAQSGSIVSSDITISGGKGGAVNVSGTLDASNRAPGAKGGTIKVRGDTIAVQNAALDASGNAGGGTIILDGGHNATTPTTVTSSANIIARGEGAGAKGGTVKMLGDHVGLFDNAVVDVSGDGGGGTALVGGDFHGAGPEQNASMTYVSPGATIRADAITTGNGGQIAIWSNDGTRFYGTISARGGAHSGDGGFVEVSGEHYLDFRGMVDTRAPKGHTGMLLLDPDDATIDNIGDSNLTNAVGIFTATIPLTPFKVTWLTLDGQLATTAATVQTVTGSITLAQPGTLTNGNSLTFQSGANITQNAGATLFRSAAGPVSFNAVGSVTLNDNITLKDSALNVNSATFSQAAGAISAGIITGGLVTINVSGASSQAAGAVIAGLGGLAKIGGGALTLSGANTYAGGTTISAGTLAVSGVGGKAGTGAIGVGGNTLDIINGAT
ncbi:MAG: filamentous hemagglutinin N-terminal domain-containing protein, partial [Chthoniobacteraceae bacterium]